MAGGFWWLFFLSIVITSTSIAAGILPLAFSLSRKRIQAISNIGMGLLVGTSLIVIIPEGVSTLYSAYAPEAASAHHESPAPGNALRWRMVARASDISPGSEHTHPEASPERYVGLSLVLGFTFMYLINVLSTWTSQTNERSYSTISVNTLRSFPPAEPLENSSPSKKSFSMTLGLLIHAFADGIALGASANSSKPSLGLIVFFAIMFHKAPAAFGLVALLLKQGLGKRQARAHLVAFSLAAPFGAFATWLCINILGGGSSNSAHTEWWTGILLLFSAGTFLFVAMHAMQEASNHTPHHSGSHFDARSNDGRMQELEMASEDEDNKLQNALLTVIGMITPLITYFGPHHAH